MKKQVNRIDVDSARERVLANEATLVCAYENEGECRAMRLEGARTLGEFAAIRDETPKSRQIIFYCACPHEKTSARRAEELKVSGFTNVVTLKGGLDAWTEAGYATRAEGAA